MVVFFLDKNKKDQEERRPGGEGCIGRDEGLGGVQKNVPAPGP